jgi:hypothetical protein
VNCELPKLKLNFLILYSCTTYSRVQFLKASMYIVNQYGQLYERVRKDKPVYEWKLVDNIPRLKPSIRAIARFFLTEEGDVFDAERKMIIPYSSDPNCSMKFVECLHINSGFNTIRTWLLSEDGTLLLFKLSKNGCCIVNDSKVIAKNVEAIGIDIIDCNYYVKNGNIICSDNSIIEIESPIIGYWNGFIVTEAGIGMVNGLTEAYIVYMPLLGKWNQSIPINEDKSDSLDWSTLEAVIFEKVKDEIVIRRMIVQEDGYLNIRGKVTVMDSHIIINSIHEFSPFIGCILLDNKPHIYNAEGLVASVFAEGEVIRDNQITDHIFKTNMMNKNARKV